MAYAAIRPATNADLRLVPSRYLLPKQAYEIPVTPSHSLATVRHTDTSQLFLNDEISQNSGACPRHRSHLIRLDRGTSRLGPARVDDHAIASPRAIPAEISERVLSL